jgi:hypothetical protein
MTQQQTIVTTGLFIIAALFTTWGTTGYFKQARDLVDQAEFERAIPFLKPHLVALPLLAMGIFAGLKFMWDIRHPKPK